MPESTIAIETELDSRTLEAELNQLTKQIARMERALSEKRGAQNAAKRALEQATDAARGTEMELQRLRQTLERSQKKSGGPTRADVSEALQQLQPQEEATAQLREQEDLLTRQEGAVRQLSAEYADVTGQVQRQAADLEQAEARAGAMQKELLGAVGPAGAAASAMERLREGARGFAAYLGGVVRNALFQLLAQGLASLLGWMNQVAQANQAVTAAMARLRGALLILAQPLVETIIPVFAAFVNILAAVISRAAEFVSGLFGTTAADSAQAAQGLYEETQAIEETGAAAEEASKSLAGFDQINQLSSSGPAAGAEASGETAPDFSVGDSGWLDRALGQAAGWVTAALLLGGIVLVAIGAATANLPLVLAGLMMLGAGLVVGDETGTFGDWITALGLEGVAGYVTAALLLAGIALIGIGAATLNFAMLIAGCGLLAAGIVVGSESGTFQSWAEALGLENATAFIPAALALGGIALVAIGAMMGNVLVVLAGLGLIGAAVAVAYGTGTLEFWAKKLGLETVFDYVTAALQLAGIALIAIGAAMGNIFMAIAGLALLAAGIGASVLGEQTLKSWWERLQLTTIEQWVSVVLLLAGIALIAIGAAMANILMILAGMTLLAFGTVGASDGVLADWVAVLGLEKVMGWVTAGLLLGGIALVVFGIATANAPMVLAGLGLLGAGVAVGITSGTFSSWLETIVSSLKNLVKELKDKVFTPFETAFTTFRNTVAGIMEGILNGVIGLLNGFIRGFNGAIGVINNIPGVDLKLIKELNPVSIPRLARGAVIPPNREFLAVLGDQRSGYNYEVPDDKLRQLIREETAGLRGPGELRLVVTAGDSLVRELKFRLDRESQRQGVSLVKGGVL